MVGGGWGEREDGDGERTSWVKTRSEVLEVGSAGSQVLGGCCDEWSVMGGFGWQWLSVWFMLKFGLGQVGSISVGPAHPLRK
jgi:hypothetical protein